MPVHRHCLSFPAAPLPLHCQSSTNRTTRLCSSTPGGRETGGQERGGTREEPATDSRARIQRDDQPCLTDLRVISLARVAAAAAHLYQPSERDLRPGLAVGFADPNGQIALDQLVLLLMGPGRREWGEERVCAVWGEGRRMHKGLFVRVHQEMNAHGGHT